MEIQKMVAHLVGVTLLGSLVACTNVVKDERDPLENWNRGVQSFNDRTDKCVMKPIATGYRFIMPSFANDGISNVFSNVNDISVTINDLLQFKLADAGADSSRLIINSVAGLGGLVDVANFVGLEKHKEDFDQTLGVWGMPSEPYLVLPFFGSSSPRGILGKVGDTAMNPANYVGFGVLGLSTGATATAISSGTSALDILDKRADRLGVEKVIDEASEDRYEFIKNAYFQQRNYLINDGENAEKSDLLPPAN